MWLEGGARPHSRDTVVDKRQDKFAFNIGKNVGRRMGLGVVPEGLVFFCMKMKRKDSQVSSNSFSVQSAVDQPLVKTNLVCKETIDLSSPPPWSLHLTQPR